MVASFETVWKVRIKNQYKVSLQSTQAKGFIEIPKNDFSKITF